MGLDFRHIPRSLVQILNAAAQDICQAARELRRRPSFAGAVVVAFAIGIGVNTMMYRAVQELLLRPPAQVREPGRVFKVLRAGPATGTARSHIDRFNYPFFDRLRRDVDGFDGVAAYYTGGLSLGMGPDAVAVRGAFVSPAFFDVLGATAHFGQIFRARDDGAGGSESAAVLGHSLWRMRFGADSGILGRTVSIDGARFHVIGVARAGFAGIGREEVDIWLPMAAPIGIAQRLIDWRVNASSSWLHIVARLRPGVTSAGVGSAATRVARAADHEAGFGIDVGDVVLGSIIPAKSPEAPREALVAAWLGAVALTLFAMACGGVAHLVLARALSRRREVAVRLALGIGRSRLASYLITEVIILAVLGGVLALAVAQSGWVVMRRVLPELGNTPVQIPGSGLASTAALAAVAGLLISLVPLVQLRMSDVMVDLRSATLPNRTSRSKVFAPREWLLFSLSASCVALLIGCGLFVRSLQRVSAIDTGVDLERTLIATWDLKKLGLDGRATDAAFAEMRDRVQAVPGVEQAALAEVSPYTTGRAVAPWTDGMHPMEFWRGREVGYVTAIGPGFFATTGARVRGREFRADDRLGTPHVAIVNAALARVLWAGREPLGQCMHLESDEECVRIVGVIGSIWKLRLLSREMFAVYVPLQQDTVRHPSVLFARVTSGADGAAPLVQRAMQGVRADLPAVRVEPMWKVAEPTFRPFRAGASIFSAFGLLAILITVVTYSSVVTLIAAERVREIAIRSALGAGSIDVIRDTTLRVWGATLAGVMLGAVVAAFGARRLTDLLYETSPHDPVVFGGSVLLLAVITVATVACPILRVLRSSPARVLGA